MAPFEKMDPGLVLDTDSLQFDFAQIFVFLFALNKCTL